MPSAPPNPLPPPIRSNRPRLIAVSITGVLIAALLLIVVLNIESPTQTAQSSPAIVGAEELIAPGALQQEDLTGGGFDPNRSIDVALPSGAAIEVQEGDRVAQRYRFSHSEPKPGGWIELQEPEVELYLSDDRLIVMTGRTALVKAPQRTLVSGTLTGDVVIRMFELDESDEIDLDADTPALIVRTAEAQFDNMLGEVRCDGVVDIQSPDLHMPGKGLRLKINDQLRRPEWLSIDKVDYLLLASLPQSEQSASSSNGASAAKPQGGAKVKHKQRDGENEPAATRPVRRVRQLRANSTAETPPFYRFKLHDNVVIRQGNDQTGWVATGDELNLIFSFRGRTLRQNVSQRPAQPFYLPGVPAPEPTNLFTFLSSLAFASTQAVESDFSLYESTADEVRITFTGNLTMEPLKSDTPRPASTDDSRLELVGTPVHLVNHADKAEVTCASLQYENPSRMLRLVGSPEHALAMNSPEVRAGGQLFWLDQNANVGGFDKGGWLEFINTDQNSPPAGATQQAPATVRVMWTNSVRFEFERTQGERPRSQNLADAGGMLRSATFSGDVHATVNEGEMSADTLALSLKQTADRRTIPQEFVAAGNVIATDREQIIWADKVVATFRENPTGTRPDQTIATEGRMRGVEVETMLVTGDVQVRLPDGSRAFADVLDANAIDGLLVLEATQSPTLVIASQTMVIDQGRRLEVYRETKTGRWPGAGRARVFKDPVIADDRNRVACPNIDEASNPVQTLATWSEDMNFDSTVNDGAGSITLRGNVAGESTPSSLERTTLAAGSLTLEFAHVEEDAPPTEAVSEGGAAVLSRGKRQLMQLIARDNARLESKNWAQADHSDEPRIFYLIGPEIIYNNLTLEARVPGEGKLVVHDPRPEAPNPATAPAQQNQAPITHAPFAAKGSSLFHWMGGLEMTRDAADLYTIVMSGSVDAIHRDLGNSETVFRGDTLAASALRTQSERPAPTEGAVDLGGSMELKRLRGLGSIYVRTPQRDVTCDEFDYNLISRVSRLAAAPNSNVMVITRGSPHPIRAQEMEWNMEADSISIIRGAGTVPR